MILLLDQSFHHQGRPRALLKYGMYHKDHKTSRKAL